MSALVFWVMEIHPVYVSKKKKKKNCEEKHADLL